MKKPASELKLAGSSCSKAGKHLLSLAITIDNDSRHQT